MCIFWHVASVFYFNVFVMDYILNRHTLKTDGVLTEKHNSGTDGDKASHYNYLHSSMKIETNRYSHWLSA